MPTLDLIIALYTLVDDRIKATQPFPEHSQQRLSAAELITIGLLYALKGQSQSRFYRWLTGNYGFLFPRLPERTRLFRRLSTRQQWADLFLAEAGLLGVADSFGVELLHPAREGRDPNAEATKGLSNHRWIVGVKLGVLVNHLGRVVAWLWNGANAHDSAFCPGLIAPHEGTITYTDSGFHARAGDPERMRVCRRGQGNFRFVIESVFSLWARFLGLKHITERRYWPIQAHLAFSVAAFNIIQELFANQPDEKGRIPIKMTPVCL